MTVPADPEWGCCAIVSGGPGYLLHGAVGYELQITTRPAVSG